MRLAALAVLAAALNRTTDVGAQVPPGPSVDTLPWNVAAGRFGSVRLGFAFLDDVDGYSQSAVNEAQVGQASSLTARFQWELR